MPLRRIEQMASSGPGTGALGRLMIYAAWILLAALLSWMFADILDRQRNPNQSLQTRTAPSGVREVVLVRNRQGHYVATGSINGSSVELLLDTGATHVSVPAGLARRLDLERGPALPTRTANGVITTYRTRLDSVSVGEIVLRNVAASINPHAVGEEVLLGMAFLKRLELIQRGDTLTLRQHP